MTQQPDIFPLLLTLPQDVGAKLRHKCQAGGVSLEDIVGKLLTRWTDEAEDQTSGRVQEVLTAEDVLLYDAAGKRVGGEASYEGLPPNLSKPLAELLAARSFMEWLPHDACIKNSASRVVWCNGLFVQTAGADNIEAVLNKDSFEIWSRDRERAERIRQLDLKVIENGSPLCNVDKISYPDWERPRVCVRFPLGDKAIKPVQFIGKIGFDFHSMEEAEAAAAALKLDGKWTPWVKASGQGK